MLILYLVVNKTLNRNQILKRCKIKS